MSHRQEKVEEDEEEKTIKRSSHHEYSRKKLAPIMSSNQGITELTWENGQLSFNGLGSFLPPDKQTTTTTYGGGDTLESIVHQGYNSNFKSFSSLQPDNNEQSNHHHHHHHHHHEEEGKHEWFSDQNTNTQQAPLSSAGKWIPINPSLNQQVESEQPSSIMPTFSGGFIDQKKRERLHESEKISQREMKRCHHHQQQVVADDYDQQAPEIISACASASAAFCREKDSTLMTWPSFESPRSLKTSMNNKGDDFDSACNNDFFSENNQDGERMTAEEETYRYSQSSARRSRASAIHNQSERRRRDRINQKMKALQRLVPNASKSDKASMLDEVIQYLKQLQSQIQMMSSARMINHHHHHQQQMMMAAMMMMPTANNNNNNNNINNNANNNVVQQQQQFQMAAALNLSRMGMLDNMARSIQQQQQQANNFFMPNNSSFVMPPPVNNGTNSGGAVPSFNHAYDAFLTQQSMNADFFNKMASMYGPTANQLSKK